MRCLILVQFFALCLAVRHPLPRFTINLDLPPHERWVTVAKKYASYAPEMRSVMKSWFPKKWKPFILKAIQKLEPNIPKVYRQEMLGVASAMNMTYLDTVTFNLVAEILARCTSIVAQDLDGNIIHGRNLDAIFKAELWRALSADVDFVKDGTVLYRGTANIGRVGLFTGERPGVFSFSANARASARGDKWKTLIMMLSGAGKIGGLVIRDALESATTFSEAVRVASETPLDVPGYSIIGGTRPNEGAVITRSSIDTPDVYYLNSTVKRWFLLQTNYDRWVEPPKRDDRRHPGIKAMQAVGQSHISFDTLFDVLSTRPVLNPRSVYTTIMHAKNPSHYQSYFRKV